MTQETISSLMAVGSFILIMVLIGFFVLKVSGINAGKKSWLDKRRDLKLQREKLRLQNALEIEKEKTRQAEMYSKPWPWPTPSEDKERQ